MHLLLQSRLKAFCGSFFLFIYDSFKDINNRWEMLETTTGKFTLILGVQVVSVYSYIEPTTD